MPSLVTHARRRPVHTRCRPPTPSRRARRAVPRAVFLLLLVAASLLVGCGGSQKALLARQESTIDSLVTVAHDLRRERDSLHATLLRTRSRVDTLVVYVQQEVTRTDSLFEQRADSLRHSYVVQFLKGQEIRGRLRGETLDIIYFEPGSTKPIPESYDRLNNIAAQLRRMPDGTRFLIEGHTDDVPFASPGQQNNRALSAERAAVVKAYLVERTGLDPGRFETAGYGADLPLMPNDTSTGRQLNRRVRIAVLKPQ